VIYFKTENSHGTVSDEAQLPPGATVITQAEYDVLVQAAADAQAAQFQAELQAAYQRYTDTFAAYCAQGMPPNVAAVMAAQAGIQPPDFDPTTCPPAL
jgi:hypothetical protein